MKITGVQKVVQTFLKTLLTSKGSDPFYPERGTLFQALTINANQTTSDPIFISSVTDCINDAASQVQAGLNFNNPDPTSCISSAQLISLDKYDDSLVIYVQIITLSGLTTSVALPFPEFGLSTSLSR